MAGLYFTAVTDPITLSSATAKTILRVKAPAAQRVKVSGASVSFAGTSGTAAPVKIRLLRQTTDGTFTSLTPKATCLLASGESISSTAGHTATAEPTAGDVIREFHVHPQTGYFPLMLPGQEIIIGPGGRLGIECTAPAGVDVIGELICEE